MSPAYSDVDAVPDDDFFESVDFKGAFGNERLWISEWSWLSAQYKLTAETPIIDVTEFVNVTEVNSETSDALDDGEIAGLVVGVFFALVIAAVLAGVFCYQRGKKQGLLSTGRDGDFDTNSGAAVQPSTVEMTDRSEESRSEKNATKGGYMV